MLLSLLLLVYVVGVFVIGIPMGFWSIRLWRKRNGKKNPSFAFLFPLNYYGVGYLALEQGYGTYERGESLLRLMVSESALLNSVYESNTDAQLICARYVFVSALAWPLRCVYLVVAWILATIVNASWRLFGNVLPTLGGKLILRCKYYCAQF